MKQVMIVDDSLIMRVNLKRMLEKQGCQIVAEAADGQEAVEKFMKFRPDLVTMDITMPVLDGISALQKIRMIDSNACVVMISALGQEIKIIEAMNKGARNYIIKPFQEKDVINMIADIFGTDTEESANVYVAQQ
jgi:two-component system chemotaxis response regulator CheY